MGRPRKDAKTNNLGCFYIPRLHYARQTGYTFCGMFHVEASKLAASVGEITCKSCLRKMDKGK